MKTLLAILLFSACTSSKPPASADADPRAPDGAPSHVDAVPLASDAAPVDAGVAVDADLEPDARPHGDLAFGDDCDLLQDQCGAGLTCRFKSLDPVIGSCQFIGDHVEGQSCSSANDQCGYDMQCEYGSYCYVWCDTGNPGGRCAPGQACIAEGTLGDPWGFCDQGGGT